MIRNEIMKETKLIYQFEKWKGRFCNNCKLCNKNYDDTDMILYRISVDNELTNQFVHIIFCEDCFNKVKKMTESNVEQKTIDRLRQVFN